MTFYISPARRLASLSQMMDRMMQDMTEVAQEREFSLALDVQATDDAYMVHALVPGLETEDLSVEVINNTVTIRGEFKSFGSEDGKYLLSELPAGRFTRSVTLPTALDSNKVDATLKNGVLTLHIPKAESHRPRAIQIKK